MAKKVISRLGIIALLFSILLPLNLVGSSQGKEMTLGLLGDCILSRKVSPIKEPGFLELVKIMRSLDCLWANCEMPLVEPGTVYAEFTDSTVIACDTWGADEFKWMGVDLVGLANNHTIDYGKKGLFSTMKHLRRVGISYAGAGKDLEMASKPGYVDTIGGRISQVNCAFPYDPACPASLPHPYQPGRPGLNPMRHERIYYIKKEIFHDFLKATHRVDREIYKVLGLKFPEEEAPKDELYIDKAKFKPAKESSIDGELNQKDLARITESVKIARRNSRIVIVSIHDHMSNKDKPGKFMETFAHACIDAGADVFCVTGPHRLLGIEIYKGKPIFYSLGNFFFHRGSFGSYPSENMERFKLPHDSRDASLMVDKVVEKYFKEPHWWEGILPVITFDDQNKVKEIKLYPVELNQKKPRYEQGTPTLLSPKKGKAIIQRLMDFSKDFNTPLTYHKGLGLISLQN